MTESDIYPLIKSIAGGQVYPYVVKLNPQGQPAVSPPWVVFSFVNQASSDVLCGPAETRNSLQLDVYSKTIAEARRLRSEAIESLSSLHPSEQMQLQGYESDVGLFRATADLQFID